MTCTFADSDRRADDGRGLGLAPGKPLGRPWNIELALSGSSLNGEGGGEYDLVGLGVDAMYLAHREVDFTPYGVVKLGALKPTSRVRTRSASLRAPTSVSSNA